MSSQAVFSPTDRAKLPSDRGVSLALVLAIGLALLWGALAAWVATVVGDHFTQPPLRESIVVDREGQPVIVRGNPSGRADDEEYFTLDRKPRKFEARSSQLHGADFGVKARSTESWFPAVESGPYVTGFADAQRPPASWYFVLEDPARSEYFVGYDSRDHRRIGYLTEKGFQTDVPNPDAMFDVPGTENGPQFLSQPGTGYAQPIVRAGFAITRVELISRDRLLQVDFQNRSVTTLVELPGMCSFKHLQRRIKGPLKVANGDGDTDFVGAVRGRDAIVILDQASHPAERFTIPAELRDGPFQFYERPDHSALAVVPRAIDHDTAETKDLVWFTQDGTITKQVKNVTAPYVYNQTSTTATILPGIAVPAPIFPLLSVLLTRAANGRNESEMAGFWRRTRELWPAFTIAGLAALASLLFYWKRTAKFGEPRQASWIVFLALGGFPAYIAYLLHRRWPVRLACPSCRTDVPRDRENCAHCGKLFPPPPANGLEIFA